MWISKTSGSIIIWCNRFVDLFPQLLSEICMSGVLERLNPQVDSCGDADLRTPECGVRITGLRERVLNN